MKRLTGAGTKLEKAVQRVCNSYADDYSSGVDGFLRDLMYGGCQSGMVGCLVYYKDTLAFYKRHKAEIQAMLKDTMQDCGFTSMTELFGNKWDADDIFAEDTHNQNLLAWYGFEETARRLAEQNGVEV